MGRVWKSGWFIAHQWIADRANYFLEEAEKPDRIDGQLDNCAAALVFGSFCLEAFFNSAGRVWIPHWDFQERKLQPKEKLQLICTALNLQMEPGKPPFQCVSALFNFRNWIAHGKDERVKETVEALPGKEHDAIWGVPKNNQLRRLAPKEVREYLTQADALIDLIERKSKRKKRRIPVMSSWVAVPIRGKEKQ